MKISNSRRSPPPASPDLDGRVEAALDAFHRTYRPTEEEGTYAIGIAPHDAFEKGGDVRVLVSKADTSTNVAVLRVPRTPIYN